MSGYDSKALDFLDRKEKAITTPKFNIAPENMPSQ